MAVHLILCLSAAEVLNYYYVKYASQCTWICYVFAVKAYSVGYKVEVEGNEGMMEKVCMSLSKYARLCACKDVV